jgi:hypothetical protein
MNVTIADVVEHFSMSAAGRKIISEREAADVAARQELVDQRSALQGERAEAAPRLRETTELARHKRDAAYKAWEAAEREFVAAHNREHGTLSSINAQVAALDKELRDSAPDIIEQASREFNRMFYDLVKRMPANHVIEHHDPLTGRITKRYVTESPSQRRRSEAILAAERTCDVLKLEALTREDIVARIDALRAGLPLVVDEEVSRNN